MYKMITLFLGIISIVPFLLSSAEPTRIVVVSHYMHSVYVNNIAKDTVSIEPLISGKVNPKDYKPTTEQMDLLRKADIWFRGNEKFEEDVARALISESQKIHIVNLQEGFISSQIVEDESDDDDDDEDDDGQGTLSFNPREGKIQAEKIKQTLVQHYPEHILEYIENEKALQCSLDKFEETRMKMIEQIKSEEQAIRNKSLFGPFWRWFSS